MGFKKINGFWLIENRVVTPSVGQTVIHSSAQNVQNFDNLTIQVAWTSGLSGQISVQASITPAFYDYPPPTQTWSDLTFDVDPNAAGYNPGGDLDEGNYAFTLSGFPFPYIRFQYVDLGSGGSPASSTGTLNVFIFSKDVN